MSLIPPSWMSWRPFNSSAPIVSAAPPTDSSTKTALNDPDATEPEPPCRLKDESAVRSLTNSPAEQLDDSIDDDTASFEGSFVQLEWDAQDIAFSAVAEDTTNLLTSTDSDSSDTLDEANIGPDMKDSVLQHGQGEPVDLERSNSQGGSASNERDLVHHAVPSIESPSASDSPCASVLCGDVTSALVCGLQGPEDAGLSDSEAAYNTPSAPNETESGSVFPAEVAQEFVDPSPAAHVEIAHSASRSIVPATLPVHSSTKTPLDKQDAFDSKPSCHPPAEDKSAIRDSRAEQANELGDDDTASFVKLQSDAQEIASSAVGDETPELSSTDSNLSIALAEADVVPNVKDSAQQQQHVEGDLVALERSKSEGALASNEREPVHDATTSLESPISSDSPSSSTLCSDDTPTLVCDLQGLGLSDSEAYDSETPYVLTETPNTEVAQKFVDLAPPTNFESTNEPLSLSDGIIHTVKNRTELTILLVGETGVGKSSFLSLLANVVEGRRPDRFVQAHYQINEAGGSCAGSQTQEAMVYEFRSRNGILVRVLDTPGLADTRGLALDDLHKKSIANAIQQHITTIHAVIILANGTVARLGIATDYALTTLSSIFPRSLEKNISFVFTNVSNPLQWNFQSETIPHFLQDASCFAIDNPFSMEMRLRQLCESPQKPSFVRRMRTAVNNTYRETVDELASLFNWMNELEPQPTTEILTLYLQVQEIETRIGDALASMEQDSTKRRQVENMKAIVAKYGVSMKTYEAYKKVISRPIWSQVETSRHNTLCTAPGCYSNCHEPCSLEFSLDPDRMKSCAAMGSSRYTSEGQKCKVCSHNSDQHRHFNAVWQKKNEEQISVDQDAKAKYMAAKSQKAKEELLLAEMETQLQKFSARIKEQTLEIGRLAEEYSKISLSGNMSAQVEKAIRMLELHLDTMRGKGVGEEATELEKAVKFLRNKLSLLKTAAKSVVECLRSVW